MSSGLTGSTEGATCFVCDGTVVGRYYTLASCKTQVTKQGLVEKLGQLVGEQYMVVISEDDIICRSCHTMMNNLDRLEKEMSSVRSVILRFLEKKYDLDEGELASSKVVLPPPPTNPDLINAFKKSEKTVQTFHERKKQSAKNLKIEESEKKSNVWMQCDRCQYTTPYSSFMINHIHKHSETTPSEPAPVLETENQEVPDDKEVVGETNEEVEPEKEDLTLLNNGDHGEGIVAGEEEEEDGAILEMDMGDDGSICMVDENGMLLQKVRQAGDGQFYVVDEDLDNSKQMLSVAEDGSVQMVQVMWDDIVSADNNMQF